MDDILLSPQVQDGIYRRLEVTWSPSLIGVSYVISLFGSYTAAQLLCQAIVTRSFSAYLAWSFLASIVFGGTAIWGLHFVGMLACGLDQPITFDPIMTTLSAFLAIFFTFWAIVGDPLIRLGFQILADRFDVSQSILRRLSVNLLQTRQDSEQAFAHSEDGSPRADVRNDATEIDPLLANGSQSSSATEQPPATSSIDLVRPPGPPNDRLTIRDEELALNGIVSSHTMYKVLSQHSPKFGSANSVASEMSSAALFDGRPYRTSFESEASIQRRFSDSHSPRSPASSMFTPFPPARRNSVNSGSSFSRKAHQTPPPLFHRQSSDHFTSISELDQTSSNLSFPSGLSAILTHRSSGQYTKGLIETFQKNLDAVNVFKAFVWALALLGMHYLGMHAMIIPGGRVTWSRPIVAASALIAFLTCLIGSILSLQMELHLSRQILFAVLASIGIASMHYTGMLAANFYSSEPPSAHPGYPTSLSYIIVCIAIGTCCIASVLMSHVAMLSRRKLTEVILTKQRLWRLTALKNAAEEANAMKSDFISCASHEIRTPLHTVSGYSDLLARTELNMEQSMYLDNIIQACQTIRLITNNVLDHSKLEQNGTDSIAKPRATDIRKLLGNVAQLCEDRASRCDSESGDNGPGVELVVGISLAVPETLFMDEAYLARILLNLLSNAQKFCSDGVVLVKIVITDGNLRISVSDTGIGIPKSFMKILFQPFKQADNSLTSRHSGTGLGLSITQKLVQKIGGDISAKSVEGAGTTFAIRCPLQRIVHSPNPEPPLASITARRRLVVFHKHIRVSGTLADLWRNVYDFDVVENPDKDQLSRAHFDFILTDLASLHKLLEIQELIKERNDQNQQTLIPIFAMYSEEKEFLSLRNVPSRSNLIRVKRPIIAHLLVKEMSSPRDEIFRHQEIRPEFTKLVRFAESVTHSPNEPAKDTSSLPKPLILLAEDNAINQKLGMKLLQTLGYDVVTASDGIQAVEKFKDQHFDAILMDCQMPRMSGYDAAIAIRNIEKERAETAPILIIAVTANVSAEAESKCRESQMDDFLSKPLLLKDLEKILSEGLASCKPS